MSLPTGTGKTLIAAVVMYNFHRWFERGKIVFLAPTRPLVSQQIRACAQVTWISADHMAELTGTVPGSERQQLWESRRIFFCTPQVFENDLESGRCPAREVVCLVLDEAHKAQGDYAYVNVVRKIAAQTDRFRVLALTATPGSDRAKIQRVITNLRIAHVEVRHEDDPCLRRYMHAREMETVLVRPNKQIDALQAQARMLAATLMQPLRSYLSSSVPVEKLQGDHTPLNDARDKWHRKRGQLTPNAFDALETAYRRLSGCLTAMDLLVHEGFGSFYRELLGLAQMEQNVDNGQFLDSPRFRELWSRVASLNSGSEPVLQPKQEKLCGILLDHFANHDADTKAIVFAQYRRVVAGIESTLNRHKPLIKARCFVGQAASKGSAGMNQLEQRELVEQFKNGDGECNVLVATSIGEEGLDIGEVDLIVQYDCLSSHIRTVQRIGRTGRKRNGRAIQLVTTGQEEEALAKQKKSAQTVKKTLGRNSKWTYHSRGSFRMIPSPLPTPELAQVDLASNYHYGAETDNTAAAATSQLCDDEMAMDVDATAEAAATDGVTLSRADVHAKGVTRTFGEAIDERHTELARSDLQRQIEPASSIESSNSSNGLSQGERTQFLQQFSCRSPPVDLSLENIISQFPDACTIPSKTFRCGPSVLTNLLLSTAPGGRKHVNTDQQAVHASVGMAASDSSFMSNRLSQTEAEADSAAASAPARGANQVIGVDQFEQELRRSQSDQSDSIMGEHYGDGPALNPESNSGLSSSSLVRGTVDERTSHGCPDDIKELLRMQSSTARRTIFCPEQIRHLLPDCIDLSTYTNSSDPGRQNAETVRFRRPSYVSSLDHQPVQPPPPEPEELSAFICGPQSYNHNSGTVQHGPDQKITNRDGFETVDSSVLSVTQQQTSRNQSHMGHSGQGHKADIGSRAVPELERAHEPAAASQDTGASVVDLTASDEPAPLVPNAVKSVSLDTANTIGAAAAGAAATTTAAPTVNRVNRGLTEEQRRRIAENRKKAQARRAAVQAKQAGHHQHSDITHPLAGNTQAAPIQLTVAHRPLQSAQNAQLSTEGTNAVPDEASQQQHQVRSQSLTSGTPVEAPDSEIELGFSSPSPVATKRLRKRQVESAGLDPEPSDGLNQQRRRRCPRKPDRDASHMLQQRNHNRFADDEAVVSGDEASAGDMDTDDEGDTDSERRNSLDDFLDDNQSQPLDINITPRESQESQSQSQSQSGVESGRESDQSQPATNNMLDVYRRSLFSQDAAGHISMGFASPARQHPHRNRFRTDGPVHGNHSQESDTETESETETGAGSSSQDRQSLHSCANYDSEASSSSPQHRGGSSLWGRAPDGADDPARATELSRSSHSSGTEARCHGEFAERESSDGYVAEAEEDAADADTLGLDIIDIASSEPVEADFDCGVDSLWD